MLLKNNKRFDRKGGKFSQKWLGPYTVMNMSDKGVATLKSTLGVTLKNKYNIVQLKHYIQGADDKSKSTSNEESATFSNSASDEIVEIILLYAVKQSENSFPGHNCETYASLQSTYHKWACIIEGKGPALPPKIYIDMWKPVGKSYNGKVIVSTRKLTSIFGKSSGIANQLSNYIGHKKWRSSWLILTPEKHSWYTIDRFFWKTKVCQPNQSSSQVSSSRLKNELDEITEADRKILESKDGWLNDNLMYAGQQLIYKALGILETYQLVLNFQKKELIWFPVSDNHTQLLRDSSCHWLLAFTLNIRVQVCGIPLSTSWEEWQA